MISDSTVQLGHGSGGQMMKRLIDEVFLDAFEAPELHAGNDAGVAALPSTGRIALSTDTFVVTPHFFPGGDIGRLAVCGTVNDVATSGARVRYLSCGFILEEGFPLDDLRRICQSMAETAREAGVAIITGDTKVVNHGSADGVYINTAGVGVLRDGIDLSAVNIKPGDKVTIVEPSVYPDELVNPLCAELEKYPMVGAAYLQIMVINGATKSYLLVLDAPKDDALFKAAGDAARPFLVSNEKKMNLNITISTSPLGQQGMRGSEPFYIKGQGRVDNLDDDED